MKVTAIGAALLIAMSVATPARRTGHQNEKAAQLCRSLPVKHGDLMSKGNNRSSKRDL